MTVTLEGPSGAAAAALASLPAGPQASPLGDLWLDHPSLLILDINTIKGGVRTFSCPVSPQLPLGLAVACQSLVLGSTGIIASTPVVVIRH